MTSSTGDLPPRAAPLTEEGALGVTAEAIGQAHHFGRSTLRLLPHGDPWLEPELFWDEQDPASVWIWGAFAQVGGRVVLAIGGDNGAVRLSESASGAKLHTLVGHTGPVWWGAFARVGGRVVLATGGDDATVRLWDPANGTELHTLVGHTGPVWWGAFARVGGRVVLATGGDDATVRLWDPASGTNRGVLTGHTGRVRWGTFTQTEEREVVLATGGDDATVRLWDPASGTNRGVLTGHTGRVRWGTFTQTEEREVVLATGGDDATVRLWDLSSPTELHILSGRTNEMLWGTAAHVGDRAVLATAGEDGAVQLWDPGWGAQVHALAASAGGVPRWGVFAQLEDRMVLATGGDDGTVRLWDPDAGVVLATGSSGTVLGWDPDAGTFAYVRSSAPSVRWGVFAQVEAQVVLATGHQDGTVRRWELVEEQTIPRLYPYRSDEAVGADALDRSVEATALAELITSQSARPPLAVGLFGDWGEGKSYFLHLLQTQVRVAAARGGPVAHEHVRQVRFNAWHYAETDLWASLVSEVFRQLAAPPPDLDDPQRGGESVVEREAHQREQSRLAAEIIARRGTAERLAAALNYRDDLRATLRAAPHTPWDQLPTDERKALRKAIGHYGPGLDEVEKLYTIAAGQGTWLRLKLFRLRQFRRGLRGGRWLLAVLVLLLVAGLAVGLAVLAPLVVQWVGRVAAAVGAGGLLTAYLVSRERIGQVREQVMAATARVRRAGEAQQRQIRAELDAADAEVDALHRELHNLTAAGQLAGLVADRAAAGDYRRSLGLMTHIREDFERMADLLTRDQARHALDSAAVQGAEGALGDGLPRIDRIVLYVDDLDRCPPDRVVAMLEAIHLLLAVPLFVVVVAVDPRWLRRAVSTHYRDLLDPELPVATPDLGEAFEFDELAAATPDQYLEKIFQVVMTLPPLRTTGYTTLLDTLVGVRADQTPTATDAAASTERADVTVLDPTGPAVARGGYTADLGAIGAQPGDGPLAPSGPVKLPAVRHVERIDPLALSGDERRLLDLLGPPLITTPRSVKRLANSYGLFTALRRLRQPDAVEDPAATRAAMVLLAALIGFPALGPRLLTTLRRLAAQHSTSWQGFLDRAAPADGATAAQGQADDGPVESLTPPGQTGGGRRWSDLIHVLSRATDSARAAGLTLPEDLRDWTFWLSDVGRLSFPAGPVAAAFDTDDNKQRPTSRRHSSPVHADAAQAATSSHSAAHSTAAARDATARADGTTTAGEADRDH